DSYVNLVQQHKWFTNVSHHGLRPNLSEYTVKINQLEASLKNILRPYFQSLDAIDLFLKKDSLSIEDIMKLKRLITNYASLRYFFDYAKEKWFDILRENQIFAVPSSLIREGKNVRFVKWPASDYLLRVAKEKPQEVCDTLIMSKIPNDPSERNMLVIEDFIDIALIMPTEYACRLVKHFLREDWLHSPYFYPSFQDKSLELAMKLLEENRYEGKQIIDMFLSTKSIKRKYTNDQRFVIFNDIEDFKSNPFRNLDSNLLNKITEEFLPILFEKFPNSTFELLLKTLCDILVTYKWIDKNFYLNRKGIYSLFVSGYMNIPSTSWMRSIEEAMGNREHLDPRARIAVEIARGLLEFENNPIKLKQCVNIFAKYHFPVINRLELWTYSRFPTIFKKKIDSSIIKYFDNYELYHEHYDLIKYCFSSRRQSVKSNYLKKLKAVENQKIREYKKLGYSQEDIDKDFRGWKLRCYEPIEKYLPKKEREWFRDQIQSGYRVPFPGFLYEIKVTRNYQHGIDIGLSLTMSPQQIVDMIYQYIHSDKYGGYDEITASRFKEAIKNKPYAFSLLSREIRELNLEYCYQYISALDEAVYSKKHISWNNILSLCSHLLKHGTPFYKYSPRVGNAIASLIINGLASDKPIPFKNRRKIWTIIKLMVNISLKEDELSFLENDKEIRQEYSYLVSNSNVGSAVELLLKYIIWCYDNLNKKSVLIEEGRKLLDEVVRTAKNLGTLGPICFYLNTLIIIDKNWTRQNLDKILIPKSDNKVLYYALWECYFVMNRCVPDVFDFLFPWLEKRVEDLKNDPKSVRKSLATRNLIVYITQAYLFEFKKSELLLNVFLSSAPRDLKSLFISEIGVVLQRRKEGLRYNFKIQKIQQIWERSELQDYPELMNWFVNSPFNKRVSLLLLRKFLEKNQNNFEVFQSDMLLFDSVVRELKNYVNESTVPALKCIGVLSKIANKKGLLVNIKDIVFEAINIVLKVDSKARIEIDEIRDFYGRCGFTEFRT
ncbi:MAG TPA: hypothetical protein VFB48_04135, partial [Nitrososphaeraceae archaeon]|nr:hypothetical protein [Nitrososphaeraceae archaeon]